MRLRTWTVASAGLALAGVLAGAAARSADEAKPAQPIPEGFVTGEFVVIEKRDGQFAVLQRPQIRTLGGKTYLAGKTIPLAGVTDDELFAPTTQWVCLDDARRVGEVPSRSALNAIQELAAQRRAVREQLASGKR
jgi:hypothetical protein